MKWEIERNSDDVIIVRMNSNQVNKMNPNFFKDLHECFDVLDNEYPQIPLVLTGNDKIFSAGIDFDYSFELFSRQKLDEIRPWFEDFSGAILRVFTASRLTVAAINGHCFAGGLILALCCDFRIGIQGESKFSLNEVPIGIPMPSTYTEIIKYRIGSKNASDAILTGAIYNAEQAKTLSFVHEIVQKEALINETSKQARCIAKPAWPAYILSKEILNAPVLEYIKNVSLPFDLKETLKVLSCDASLQAQRAAFNKLKGK